MHLRASQIRGIPVIDDGTQQVAGFLDSPLIDPDTGRILGFFILPAVIGVTSLFLPTQDIIAWGTRVHIRSEDCLSPPDELIRLKSTLEDPRQVIGQSIRTKETKRSLGTCSDVQFNTRHFMTEWMFPRKFFLGRQPLPMSDVLEITPEAIWVKDPLRPVSLEKSSEELQPVPSVIQETIPSVQTRGRF